MKKNVLIVLLSIFIFSCNNDDDNSKITTIESTLIAKGNLYGNGAEGIVEQKMVILDQSTWNDFIIQMNSVNNVSDDFSETDIDFSKYKIIAVFNEIKGNGGYSIGLNIVSNSQNIVVSITDLVPGGNATTVITQPYHIVKIPIIDLPIIFE